MTVRVLGTVLTLMFVCLVCFADSPQGSDRQSAGSSSATATRESTPFTPDDSSEKSPYGLLLAFVILAVVVVSVMRLALRAQSHGYGDGRGIDSTGAMWGAGSGSGRRSGGGGGFGGGQSSGGGASGGW